MPNFRFHRGSLKESLSTEVEVTDMNELIRLVENAYDTKGFGINELNLTIRYYGFDKRIGKDLYSVRDNALEMIGWLDKPFEVNGL